MMKQGKYLILILLLCCGSLFSQEKRSAPMIGAQVFIEPGQSDADIDSFFRILSENNMTVARIRLFGSHMLREDKTWDFSLYDSAFDAADKYGIKLFATLFPPTDELTDVGGFKFPRSRKHLEQVALYIKAMVTHFKDKQALYTWVLQNEPGTSGVKVAPSELSQEIHTQWIEANPVKIRSKDEFLKADFSNEQFLVYYTNWYLNWIATEVCRYDKIHNRHINPHQIFEALPEYDFASYEKFLTSLGISMHLSWHFGYFNKEQYPMAISAMADVTRSSAGSNPFWITELQGGNVTASGDVPLCPTDKQIAQWLWTGIAAGSRGVIFWTLNQRASVMESGEWGMIDFQRKPTDRLLMASKVAATINSNKDLFAEATPVSSGITILYNNESLWIQKRNASIVIDPENEGRMKSATTKSVVAAYEAISAYGITADIAEMNRYDWSSPKGKIVVLPNIVSIPDYYKSRIEEFVKGGGRMIVTGLSGYYDQNMRCQFMNIFPYEKCFGGNLSEYKVVDRYFGLPYGQSTMPAHLWQGIIVPTTSQAIASDDKGHCIATRNTYGAGDVIWFPSLIELGGWHRDNSAVTEFYAEQCHSAIQKAPVSFKKPMKDVLMRTMQSKKNLVTILINTQPKTVNIELCTDLKSEPRLIFGDAKYNNSTVEIGANGCTVYVWDRK